eukprot:344564-Pelagomonas_calceolata.AAC.2
MKGNSKPGPPSIKHEQRTGGKKRVPQVMGSNDIKLKISAVKTRGLDNRGGTAATCRPLHTH